MLRTGMILGAVECVLCDRELNIKWYVGESHQKVSMGESWRRLSQSGRVARGARAESAGKVPRYPTAYQWPLDWREQKREPRLIIATPLSIIYSVTPARGGEQLLLNPRGRLREQYTRDDNAYQVQWIRIQSCMPLSLMTSSIRICLHYSTLRRWSIACSLRRVESPLHIRSPLLLAHSPRALITPSFSSLLRTICLLAHRV